LKMKNSKISGYAETFLIAGINQNFLNRHIDLLYYMYKIKINKKELRKNGKTNNPYYDWEATEIKELYYVLTGNNIEELIVDDISCLIINVQDRIELISHGVSPYILKRLEKLRGDSLFYMILQEIKTLKETFGEYLGQFLEKNKHDFMGLNDNYNFFNKRYNKLLWKKEEVETLYWVLYGEKINIKS
ncbi:MAG: hypothetical protein PHN31_01425, partial [Candidatus Gracilibacteria bacterium]|nr:hypothetical protein [Candidatus Gracilibacteria bacterium]